MRLLLFLFKIFFQKGLIISKKELLTNQQIKRGDYDVAKKY